MNIQDKLAGALYGQALGDAMGMPTELWGIKKIRSFFGGPVRGLIDGPKENIVARNYERGQYTDDTCQALILLDSLADTDYVPDAGDIAAKLLDWAVRVDAFENHILGPTSKVALEYYRDGKDASEFTSQALSNGSSMRIGPVGSMLNPADKQKFTEYIYEVTRATHTSDVTIAGAAMVAMGTASAVVHDDFDDVMKDILEVEPFGYDRGAETFSPRLAERLKIGMELADRNRGNEQGFLDAMYNILGAGVPIIESVPTAITISYYAQDPNYSAYLCANLGGDTDTIGAMATTICGAFTGKSGIEKEYIETLEQQNPIDFDGYVSILEKGREKLA